jgi:hypothetical protein
MGYTKILSDVADHQNIMKYTLDQVAYPCRLAPSAAQQYAWKLDLGFQVGRREMNTEVDTLTFLNSSIPTNSPKPRPRAKQTGKLASRRTAAKYQRDLAQ